MKSTVEKVEELFKTEYESFEQMLKEIEYFAGSSASNRYQLAEYIAGKKPGSGEQAIKLAAAGLIVGDYQRAVSFLREAPEGAQKRWLLGLAFKGLEDYEHAIADFERARNKGWDEPEVLAELIEVSRLSGDIKSANEYLKQLKKVAPKSQYYYYQQGRITELQGDYEQAMELYAQAIESSDNYVPAIFRLAYMEDLHGNEEYAIELYQRCLKHQPVNINAMLNLVVLYEDRGEYYQALGLLKQVLEVYPNHTRARLFLKDVQGSLTMRYDEETEKQRDKFQQVLEMPISDFELSVRSRNCLKKMGIRTLGDLTRITEAELLAYKNFGETSLNEIKAILTSKNLRLGQAVEDKASKKAASVLPGSSPADTTPGPEVLNKSIDELQLSVRSKKCLQNLDIQTIGDLLEYSEAKLMSVKNFGAVSLNEIKDKLALFGISLRPS